MTMMVDTMRKEIERGRKVDGGLGLLILTMEGRRGIITEKMMIMKKNNDEAVHLFVYIGAQWGNEHGKKQCCHWSRGECACSKRPIRELLATVLSSQMWTWWRSQASVFHRFFLSEWWKNMKLKTEFVNFNNLKAQIAKKDIWRDLYFI